MQQTTGSSVTPLSRKKRKRLSGIIVPRQPRIKTENKNYLLDKPGSSAYYSWRPEGRGQVIVDETGYNRITELLLRLDFANLELASSSSWRWINEVRSGAGSMSSSWGVTVTGTRVTETAAKAGEGGINTLNIGLVRKKRKAGAEEVKESAHTPAPIMVQPEQVNLLGASMIRKKAKT